MRGALLCAVVVGGCWSRTACDDTGTSPVLAGTYAEADAPEPAILTVAGDEVVLEEIDADGRTIEVTYRVTGSSAGPSQ